MLTTDTPAGLPGTFNRDRLVVWDDIAVAGEFKKKAGCEEEKDVSHS